MKVGKNYQIKKRPIDSEERKILSILAPLFSAMNKIRMRLFSGPWPFREKEGKKENSSKSAAAALYEMMDMENRPR